jgi:RNA polymerase sigma-70 factor (ECF subfamily)
MTAAHAPAMRGAVSDIEACIPLLRRHAAALLHDRREIDNLVHSCLARALVQDKPAGGEVDTHAWLLAIMYRLLAGRPWRIRLRRASQQTGREGPAALRDLGRLAGEQRAVLLLVAVENLPYAEVARILGISLPVVMSLLADGRENLRRLGADTAPAGNWRLE